MSNLGDATLLVVGRSLDYDGDQYYMSGPHWELLAGLADYFADAVYLCQRRDGDRSDELTRVDESRIRVRANADWRRGTPVTRLASLRRDAEFVASLPEPLVTYTYYPGFYSFLLSPSVLRAASYSFAHFGSDAVDTAEAAYDTSLRGRAKRACYRYAQRYVLANTDTVFSTDPAMERRYPDAPITESAPVIDFDLSDLQRVAADPFDAEPYRLLFVGPFRPVKGLDQLVEAFASLHADARWEFELRLVGDGTVRDEIEAQVRRHGVEDAVEFTGYIGQRERLVEQYRTSDVLVIPSLKESVPRVLYEGTAVGLPVVATSVGGIPTLLEHGVDALLVEPEDPAAIASAVRRLAMEDGLADQLVATLSEKIEWHLGTDALQQRLDILAREFQATDVEPGQTD